MKKLKFIALIAICASGVLFALGAYKFSVSTHAEQNLQCCRNSLPSRNAKEIQLPGYVPYMFLFQHLANIKDNASQVQELHGRSGLSNEQFGKLMLTAAKYQRDVSELDAQAKIIIDDFHAKYPHGRLPDGIGPPQAPQELNDLQEKRNAKAIFYRDQLKTELGNDGYERFKMFVNNEVTSKMTREPSGKPLYQKQGGEMR